MIPRTAEMLRYPDGIDG